MPEVNYGQDIAQKIEKKATFTAERRSRLLADQNLQKARTQIEELTKTASQQLTEQAKNFQNHFEKTVPYSIVQGFSKSLANDVENIADLKKLTNILTKLDQNITTDLIAYKTWKVKVAQSPFWYFWISIIMVCFLLVAIAWEEKHRHFHQNQEAITHSYWEGVNDGFQNTNTLPNGYKQIKSELEEGLIKGGFIK